MDHYKSIHDKAQTIVKAFKNAHLQLARLRQYQVQVYGKQKALILSVITRWGTHYRQVESVYNNKDALRLYASNPEFIGKISTDALGYIQDPMFWMELDDLWELFHPINKALKESESDRANLGRVVPRWDTIHIHLDQKAQNCSDLKEYLKLNGINFNNLLF